MAFSLGKDAICANHALRDAGVETRLAYLFLIPDLGFVQRTVAELEDHFGQQIRQYPHPSLFRWLRNSVFQPPERLAVIEAANLVEPSYELTWDLIREDTGLDADTWVADGVRANDSQQRRMAFKRFGVMKPKNRKVSPVWDWSIAEIRECMADKGVPTPVDYGWFGRSFDGIDPRFLEPLKANAPEDYQRVLDWFPLADLGMVRHGL
ncbi:hypothetical protein [Brevibacterium otitidis]|uniref:Phosphoadenosine phosphosulfate reductase n=1 Tax=Brevibacterium otitidis TaxID=53364 RepID=A0ABV5X103_9MICO